jgi:ABC-type nitrate/sulfonate/bicarbonate transport system permease component
MLLNQNKQMQLDAIFAIQLTIFVIGIGIDYAAGVTHQILFRYCHINVGGGR